MTLDNFAAILASGIVLGSLYALMSIGLSLVWGTLKVFNFVHGAQLALGAFVAWTVADQAGLGWGLAAGAVVAIAVLAVVGVGINEVLVRPFMDRRNADLITMVTTIAGAALVQNGI